MTEPRKLTTDQKIVKCKTEIETAKSYADYYDSMELEELAKPWHEIKKRLAAELYELMQEQKREKTS